MHDPRQLADEGRAVAIVTHDERVLSIADRLVNVVDGRVVPAAKEAASAAGAGSGAAGPHLYPVRRVS